MRTWPRNADTPAGDDRSTIARPRWPARGGPARRGTTTRAGRRRSGSGMSSLLPQQIARLFREATETGDHRAPRDAADLRDLRLSELVDVIEPRRERQILGDLADQAEHQVALRETLLAVARRGFWKGRDEQGTRATVAQLVEAMVGCRPIQPGQRLPLAFDPRQVVLDAEEDLLRGVLGRRRIAQDLAAARVDDRA